MKNYYADFLVKKSENLPLTSISKVSKVAKEVIKQAFDTFDTEYPDHIDKKNSVADRVSPVRESTDLIKNLNVLVARGISFHPTADRFQIENVHLATAEDLEFLRNYSSGILCVLQQALVTKWIFTEGPTFLDDFKHEITERELLMTGEEGEISNEVQEQAVIEVTKSWFTNTFKDYL